MSVLSINAHLKFIEFIIHSIDELDDTKTIGEVKRKFRDKFNVNMPILMDQNFGIVRLVPLLLMRESLKNEKLKTQRPYDKRIDIVRHAIAHDNFSSDETGYTFISDKGSVQMGYDEFVKFVHETENDFYRTQSE